MIVLSDLVLPSLVGAMLAYIFRPLKTFGRTPWLPDGVRIAGLFLLLGVSMVWVTRVIKNQVPNEIEQMELKIRLQYKLNERSKEILGYDVLSDSFDRGKLPGIVAKEFAPMIQDMHHFLALSQDEVAAYGQILTVEDRPYRHYFEELQKGQMSRALIHRGVAGDEQLPVEDSFHQKRSLIELLSIWILAPMVFLFLFIDNGGIARYFLSLVPNRFFELTLTVMEDLDSAIGRYLRGTFMECALVGLTFMMGLLVLGIPLGPTLLIGSVAGLTNAIPFLGPAIGLAVSMAYALVTEDLVPLVPFLRPEDVPIGIIAVVLITQALDNIFYQPVILGSAVSLHPLVVILGVMGGAIVFGFAGMLLSVPVLVVLKTTVETLSRELYAYRIIR